MVKSILYWLAIKIDLVSVDFARPTMIIDLHRMFYFCKCVLQQYYLSYLGAKNQIHLSGRGRNVWWWCYCLLLTDPISNQLLENALMLHKNWWKHFLSRSASIFLNWPVMNWFSTSSRYSSLNFTLILTNSKFSAHCPTQHSKRTIAFYNMVSRNLKNVNYLGHLSSTYFYYHAIEMSNVAQINCILGHSHLPTLPAADPCVGLDAVD